MNEYKVSRIIIGGDHLGLPLKKTIADFLKEKSIEVCDMGVNSSDPVDYPDIGEALALKVAGGDFERGILVCGTGAGMAITANKVPGIRAVAVTDPYTAERAVASNNAQIITLGTLVTAPAVGKMLVDIWLKNEFQGGASAQKVEKMNRLDEKFKKP